MIERFAPPPPEGFARVRMTVAYDGTPFHGFAANNGIRTVQGDLEAALSTVMRGPVSVSCAGRTDRGVHARGQVVSFDVEAERFDADRLERGLNQMLTPSVAVHGCEIVPDDFDARLSCKARSYRYRVLNTAVPDPLLTNLAWHVRGSLDLAPMRLAADRILGTHDFSGFSKRNKSRPEENFVRKVTRAEWHRHGDTLQFDITARAFTHQMVRSLVGLLVDIGRGRRRAVDMGAALAALDRAAAPSPAPPHGLVLWQAHY